MKSQNENFTHNAGKVSTIDRSFHIDSSPFQIAYNLIQWILGPTLKFCKSHQICWENSDLDTFYSFENECPYKKIQTIFGCPKILGHPVFQIVALLGLLPRIQFGLGTEGGRY